MKREALHLKMQGGSHLTEKFPKSPKPTEGENVLHIPDDAVVFYDIKELSETSDEELKAYCQDLILYWNLEWDVEELMNDILMMAFISKLPKDPERFKETLKKIPGVVIEEETKRKENA